MFRNLLFFGIFIFFHFSSFSQSISGNITTAKVVLHEKSELTIHGQTNINQFTCTLNDFRGSDTINFTSNIKNDITYFDNALLTIPVLNFDCGQKMITSDFRELLNEPSYPEIKIDFLKIHPRKEDLGKGSSNQKNPDGYFEVELEVAGVKKKKSVEILKEERIANERFFLGEVELDIKDFGLIAPEKMMGLIKVKDKISITFQLSFYNLPE
ncbi:MAG: YceI family protein [Flammeovirgaceae bacterium]|nr:YceI family protein [Flammeovirgaceae bacterium]